ncbi:uncharacterized protein [Montipora foliosa]|uniref:uncharacterized protein n=1 Tax=Montipora foliosa TaxID=591990 RepID=UPI0035F1D8A7
MREFEKFHVLATWYFKKLNITDEVRPLQSCLLIGIQIMSQEVSEEAEEISTRNREILDITLLGSEWNSTEGGLSTLNRELAIHLSQQPNVRVSMLVPEGACKDEDKKAAQKAGVRVLDASQRPGFNEPRDWLGFPPQDHRMDVVVGHGVKLGRQVQVIKRSPEFKTCKWVHMVHTAPENLSKYKGYDNPTSRGEQKHWDEVDLCKKADLVVPVGARLKKAYSSYLQGSKKDEDIFEMVPGLFNREFGALEQKAKVDNDKFKVLLCGRGDVEDFELKGYDIAVKAFADRRLKGKRFYLLFVGAPDDKQDEVRRRLLNFGITQEQLIVRKFVKNRKRMKDLFCEVDLVTMPSKSEGFGLVALEALSAGLPVLVGSNSGFARALEKIHFGDTCIVHSNNPAKWAKKIKGVRAKHKQRLDEMTFLRECYDQKFSWKEQCGNLVEELWKMVYESSTFEAAAGDGLVEQQPIAIPVTVCQTDQKKMQQHTSIMERDATCFRGNAKKSRKRKTSESTCNSEEGTVCQADPKMQQHTSIMEGDATSFRGNAKKSRKRKILESNSEEGNGTGGESIYGGSFNDEGFEIDHEQPMLLPMANRGPNTNGSQFFMYRTTQHAPHLNGIHAVFGHVLQGQEVVSQIENQSVDDKSRPLNDVKIGNCGELIPKTKAKAAEKKSEKKKAKRKHDFDGSSSSDSSSNRDTESESSSSSSSSSDESVKKKRTRKKKKMKRQKQREIVKKKKKKKEEEEEKKAKKTKKTDINNRQVIWQKWV